jgi:hypothetical protein
MIYICEYLNYSHFTFLKFEFLVQKNLNNQYMPISEFKI